MNHRTKRIVPLLILGFLVCASAIFGQSMRGGQVSFDVDEAGFSANEGYVFLEIYFSIPRDAIQHQKGIGFFEAKVEMAASLFKGDSLVAEKKRRYTDQAAALTDIKPGQQLYNIFTFYAKPGPYKLRTRVTDLSNETGGWLEKNIDILAFPEKNVCLSDIQLSMGIEADTSKSMFVKNGHRIIPNPNRMYGVEIPILYYYSEIYNLSPLEKGKDSTYAVSISVEDMEGNSIKSTPEKAKKRLGTSVVEAGMINVVSLNSGPYRIHVLVKDNGTGTANSRKKDFFVYRRADFVGKNQSEAQTNEAMADEFSGMAEKELDALFKQCDYIAADKEKKLYKKLDLNGKRKFMSDFWRARDSNPLTAVNEFKQDYLERLQYVELHYGSPRKPGWRSDMGRIYLMYGKPDETERFPSNIGERPYEIWHYYQVEGGTQCYFVDIQDLGEMHLVHSTIRRELQDYQWQRWLTPHSGMDSSTGF